MTGLDKAMHEMAFFQANFMLQTPHHHDEHHHHHPPPSLNSILPQDYHGKHMPFNLPHTDTSDYKCFWHLKCISIRHRPCGLLHSIPSIY
jgi:hypothetical protein